MLGTALYYPYMDIRDGGWLRSAILFWDEIQTIVPTSIQSPYLTEDTKLCEQEGYLRPLRCDLHPELLADLGRRVFKLLEDPEWQRSLISGSPSTDILMHADKISRQIRWSITDLIGIHPDKMPPALRSALLQAGGLELISADKLQPHLRERLIDLDMYGLGTEKLSDQFRHLLRQRSPHLGGDWILVTGKFAEVYMSALAALLSKEVEVSPLTNEAPSSGVNLRCLVDDVSASGDAAARGALVSVVMKALKVDPKTPMRKLLSFRRGQKDQLAELSGLFDDLKSKIEKSSSSKELEDSAKRLFENKIQPGLNKLKQELEVSTIQSVWDGVQRGFTVSAPASGALAYVTDYSGPLLLGTAGFITLADVGVKSYLTRSKARAASPYTYLLDVERKFSLPC